MAFKTRRKTFLPTKRGVSSIAGKKNYHRNAASAAAVFLQHSAGTTHRQKQGKRQTHSPSTGKKSCHVSPLPHLHQKSLRLSKPNPAPGRWTAEIEHTRPPSCCVCYVFLTREVWFCSRAAGTKSSQKGVLQKSLDRLKLKRTNYMTLPTVCKPGPDSQREE